jgi:hypothetical protein
MPYQSPLTVAHGGKRLGELLVAPAQIGPIGLLMDIRHNHRTFCGDYRLYSPQSARLFTAKDAANNTLIHRTRLWEQVRECLSHWF